MNKRIFHVERRGARYDSHSGWQVSAKRIEISKLISPLMTRIQNNANAYRRSERAPLLTRFACCGENLLSGGAK